ncbi:DUF3048 domain-containing protein [Candidatus Peregrinibacteria bacterium]|nr:DUF3048 domain-containing protein [Candidatus Peregrinibacteria bacterium]
MLGFGEWKYAPLQKFIFSSGKTSSQEKLREPIAPLFTESGTLPSEYTSFFSNFFISPPKEQTSFFDGISIQRSEIGFEYVVGIMIDNLLSARKGQVGIDESPLVVEAVAEGGITRFLAFFSSRQNTEKVGPIRSARPYFLDFLKPLHGAFVHAGGSDEVLAELRTLRSILDIDDGYFSLENPTFWRDLEYPAPHNLFTSLAEIRRYITSSKDTNSLSVLIENIWNFSRIPLSAEKVLKIRTNFSAPEYIADWVWDEERESFVRSQESSSLDISVQNLVVMEARMWPIPDDPKGRMKMENIGTGNILFFQNGSFIRGTWKKSSRDAQIQFFDLDKNPISFLAGKTWIAILDDLQKLSFL